MRTRKIKFSFASVITLAAILVVGVGLVWASPLVDGGVYLPVVMKGYPTATPTVTPTVTPTPTPTRTPTPTNQPPPSTITNPGFEQNGGWVFSSSNGDPIRVSPFAHSGSFSAALGDGRNNRTAYISQQFYVPILYDQLEYYRYVQSVEDCGWWYDKVTIFVNGDDIRILDVCQDMSASNWKRATIDLSNFSGETIVFRMEFKSDGNTQSYFYVDDFAFTD